MSFNKNLIKFFHPYQILIMDQLCKKLPFLSLQNQYTYLKAKQKTKRSNALQQLSEQLKGFKKLPSIDKKHINTTRKVEKQILELELALKARSQNRYPLSEQRHIMPNIIPYYMPMPMALPLKVQLIQTPIENKSQVVTPPQQAPAPQPEPKMEQKPEMKQKEETQKKVKQINQFPEKSKLNKFRIYAYAVYFSIYFKFYSRKYTQLRRNWFNERYAVNDGKIIFEGSAKILKHLYEIDIYKMIQTSKQRVKDMDLEQLDIQRASNSKSKGSDSVLIMIQFVTLLMDYVHEYMVGKTFIKEHHEVFTVGVLTQNFMLTNLYLPQEAALLHIHQQGYILVDEQTQIILLMIKIVIKILVYNFLLTLKFSRHWNTKQQKSHGLDDSDMEQIWAITRNAGIFLTIVCEQIYDKTYKQMGNPSYTRNFNQLSPKFNIFPAKSLQEVKRLKAVQNPNDSNSKLIINLEGYSDVLTMISLSPPLMKFKQKIKLKIIDFLTIIYTALKYEEAVVYDFIRYMTLDEKYIIFKGIKEDMLRKKNKKKKKKGSKKDENGKSQKRKRKGGKIGNNTDSDENSGEGEFGEKGQKGHKKESRNESDEQCDDDDSSNEQGQEGGKKKKKKLRYKHEQAFLDHKFDGHYKLMKLKLKMARNQK